MVRIFKAGQKARKSLEDDDRVQISSEIIKQEIVIRLEDSFRKNLDGYE